MSIAEPSLPIRPYVDRSWRVFPAGSNGEFGLPEELCTVIAEGAGCVVRDAAGAQVYSGPLNGQTGSVATGTGVAGDWTVVDMIADGP